MAEDTDNKSDVRAWLYHLLAELEIYPDVKGTKTEFVGNKVIIELQFKS